MAQKNKGIDTVWKELQAARIKSADDRKREQELEKIFKSSVSDEILKQVSDSAGTEEDLMDLIDGLKSGKAKISIVWDNKEPDAESTADDTEMYNAISDEPDDML